MIELPSFFRVRQHFDPMRVDDVEAEVGRQLAKLTLERVIKPGDSVAITVGSRGIANIQLVTRGIVNHVKKLGGKPFLVPAMGSHGGGTAEGQREVLESYGITEAFVGVPIRASMDVISLG